MNKIRIAFLSVAIMSQLFVVAPTLADSPTIFDHFYVVAPPNLDPKELSEELTSSGFTVGSYLKNGSGSLSIRFKNQYLEFIFWPSEEPDFFNRFKDIDKELGRYLLSRVAWPENGSSPFGLGLAWRDYEHQELKNPGKLVLMDGIEYVQVTKYDDLQSPDVFIVPRSMDFKLRKESMDQSVFKHSNGSVDITSIKIQTIERAEGISEPPIEWPKIKLISGSHHFAEINLDNGAQGRIVEFSEDFPLVIRY